MGGGVKFNSGKSYKFKYSTSNVAGCTSLTSIFSRLTMGAVRIRASVGGGVLGRLGRSGVGLNLSAAAAAAATTVTTPLLCSTAPPPADATTLLFLCASSPSSSSSHRLFMMNVLLPRCWCWSHRRGVQGVGVHVQ